MKIILVIVCMSCVDGLFTSITDTLFGELKIFQDNFFPDPQTTEKPKKPKSVSPTKTVNVEEVIFEIGPVIQSFFDPSDVQAKENYIMSPLSTGILLAEYLMGTYGWNHNCVSKLMKLGDRQRREIFILEENRDPLYDDKIYHGAYHFRLMTVSRSEQSDEHQDKLKLNNAVFYKKDGHFIEHFQSTIKKFYQSDFIPLNFSDFESSLSNIELWSSEKLQYNVSKKSNLRFEIIQDQTESIFLSTLVFNTTWKFPLEQLKKKEFFQIKPYLKEKINYIQGIINQTTYIDSIDLSLVAVPLNHKGTSMFIVLPNGDDYTNFNIRRFSELLEHYGSFERLLEIRSTTRNVKLKVPDIFTQFVEFDVMKPILNYLNDEAELEGKSEIGEVRLNGASRDLGLSNMIQHIYFSIGNRIERNSNSTSAELSSVMTSTESSKSTPKSRWMGRTTRKPHKSVTKLSKEHKTDFKNESSATQPNDSLNIVVPTTPVSFETSSEATTATTTTIQTTTSRLYFIDDSNKNPFTLKFGEQSYSGNPSLAEGTHTQQLNAKDSKSATPNLTSNVQSPDLTTSYSEQIMPNVQQRVISPSFVHYPQRMVSPFPYSAIQGNGLPSSGVPRVRRRSESPSKSDDDIIDFTVNRPFVFVVMNRDTEIVLLWGSISDPRKMK